MNKTIGRILVILACTLMLAICVGCSGSSGPVSTDGSGGSGSASSGASSTASSYTVTYVSGAPDWTTVPTLDINNQPWGDPVDISAWAQVCYGADALYVHMWTREANIRAEYAADDLRGKPYEDSCLEFFLSPVGGDSRYINIEVNPNCCMGVEVGTSRENRDGLIPDSAVFQPVATRTDDGWDLQYQIPYTFIEALFPDFQTRAGGEMRANFYKCGNLTVQKHYLTWNQVTSDKPDFHRPECFGVLTFG